MQQFYPKRCYSGSTGTCIRAPERILRIQDINIPSAAEEGANLQMPKTIRGTLRSAGVCRSKTTNRKAQQANGSFQGSSTEHHTKLDVAAKGNTRQCQRQADLSLVLTDLNSVSIELFSSKQNIFKPNSKTAPYCDWRTRLNSSEARHFPLIFPPHSGSGHSKRWVPFIAGEQHFSTNLGLSSLFNLRALNLIDSKSTSNMSVLQRILLELIPIFDGSKQVQSPVKECSETDVSRNRFQVRR